MKVHMSKCPNCSAPLKRNKKEGMFFCEYCGARMFDRLEQEERSAHEQAPADRVGQADGLPPMERQGNYPYRSKWAAFFLCLFFGCLGVHRFYVGKYATGTLWLCTFGLFGIGYVADLVLIFFGSFRDRAGWPLR